MTHKQLTVGLFTIVLVTQVFCMYFFFFQKRTVYVDSNKLLENYQGMTDARKEFQKKAVQWQANIDTLKVELDRDIKKYESEKSKMSDKEKELSEKLLSNKKQQFIDYQKGIQQKSQQEDYQMTERLLTEVNAFIEEYGKRQGYTMILGANSSGNIVYAEDYLDITEELQEALNVNYKGI